MNCLLAALPDLEYGRIASHLDCVAMPLGTVLSEPNTRISHIYFPIDCIVSLLYPLRDGSLAEIAVVGCEGMVGVSLFMGGETTPSRALVQSAGSAFRVRAELLRDAFNRGRETRDLFLRYTQALLTQMAQTAVCNRHHSLDQQLCRWLLVALDRLPSATIVMTQELLANMIGVRREGVTQAAGKLQTLGAIKYRRGHIDVLSRPTLEALSCECYKVVKQEYDRLLPASGAARRMQMLTETIVGSGKRIRAA